MAVTPLASSPIPLNSDLARAMFVWVGSTAPTDPIDTDADQQALVNFCDSANVKCNTIFLDMWRYLGGTNWNATKLGKLRQFLNLCHRSGIKVFALTGDVGWGQNHAWVMKNIVQNLNWFQTGTTDATQRFDGVILDVEYWTDGGLDQATHCAGLCDLIKAFQSRLNMRVGVCAAFYLKDNDGTRPSFTYCGKNAQDGEHLMDTADFVVPMTYRDHAEDNGTDGPGQITLFQPWYDYASTVGKNKGLYAGSETIDVALAYITYFGATKATMEAQHTLISAAFRVAENSVWIGQAVHSYDGWKAMP